MWMRNAVASLSVVVLLAASAPRARGADGRVTDASLAGQLRRIETAFRGSDARALRSSFSTGRVRVDLKGLTDGPGAYGAGQLEVIFERIFDENRTREFTIKDDDVAVSGPGTAFARGRWVRRPRPGGADATDTLTFTLREEAGDWRIHEIRSSR